MQEKGKICLGLRIGFCVRSSHKFGLLILILCIILFIFSMLFKKIHYIIIILWRCDLYASTIKTGRKYLF